MLQAQDRFQVGDVVDCGNLGKVRQTNEAGRRTLGLGSLQLRLRPGHDPAALLMKVRRVKPKLVVLDAKRAAFFRDASFAQEDRLPARGEGMTDDGPFL